MRHSNANDNTANGTTTTGHGTTGTGRKNPLEWEKVFLYILKIALAATALAFVVQRWKQRNQFSGKEKSRIEFSWFTTVFTIVGSIIFLLMALLRKGKGLHHSIFSTFTSVIWIIAGALIHTLTVSLECGSHALINNGQGGALNCHQLKVIEALAWAIVALSIISALVAYFMGRRRRTYQKNHHHESNFAGETKGTNTNGTY